MEIYNIIMSINIKSFFINILEIDETVKIDNILNLMYLNNLLNTELLLNIIKALVLIFYLDKNNFIIYYTILEKINNFINSDVRDNCFNNLKKLNLSQQFKLDSDIIDDIIIYTNQYILLHYNNLEKMLIELTNLICVIQKLNTNIYIKSSIYLCVLKKSKLEQINLLNTDIINKINKFISYDK